MVNGCLPPPGYRDLLKADVTTTVLIEIEKLVNGEAVLSSSLTQLPTRLTVPLNLAMDNSFTTGGVTTRTLLVTMAAPRVGCYIQPAFRIDVETHQCSSLGDAIIISLSSATVNNHVLRTLEPDAGVDPTP